MSSYEEAQAARAAKLEAEAEEWRLIDEPWIRAAEDGTGCDVLVGCVVVPLEGGAYVNAWIWVPDAVRPKPRRRPKVRVRE